MSITQRRNELIINTLQIIPLAMGMCFANRLINSLLKN